MKGCAVSRQQPLPVPKQTQGVILGFFCFLACLFLHPSGQASDVYAGKGPSARAAIVDHLSLTEPNPSFVKACKALLEGAGFAVDYYQGEEVTVDLYRNLPAHGYKVIVLRVHSAYIHKYLSLAMFTSEPYSKGKYVYEQLRNRVASGHLQPYEIGDPQQFVITDKFVRFSMKGSFNDALIMMMGCTGVKRCAASAFIEKGAKAYIGWNGLVSAGHTDRATIELLKGLLQEKQPIDRAVTETMKEVGPEPRYQSRLLFWPIEAGKQTVHTPQNRIAKVASK
ncbi:MAG: hypothetical protein SWH78_02650 [Thermodesulfobacteriota bacterium]|nr:hypothetical protein [Thermodesulfobacteriota bacterium]